MQNELQKHYKQIQEAIKSNISTIQTLIEQADSLQKIVESITPNSADSDSGKTKELQEEIKNINSSISTLIMNTESLFKLYNDFIQALS